MSIIAVVTLSACHRDMYEEPKFLPDQENHFFPETKVDRPPPDHTVPRGAQSEESAFYNRQISGALTTTFPLTVAPELIARGQEAYDINCSVCHGRDGYGKGIIVLRGFPAPPSLHDDRLRSAPIGHFFEVITKGYGVMYPFASRIAPRDRWAIISYIRALQFSQHAPVAQLAPQDRGKLGEITQ